MSQEVGAPQSLVCPTLSDRSHLEASHFKWCSICAIREESMAQVRGGSLSFRFPMSSQGQ